MDILPGLTINETIHITGSAVAATYCLVSTERPFVLQYLQVLRPAKGCCVASIIVRNEEQLVGGPHPAEIFQNQPLRVGPAIMPSKMHDGNGENMIRVVLTAGCGALALEGGCLIPRSLVGKVVT